MGIDPEDDAIWARLMNALVSADDPDLNPDGPETVMERDLPEIVERCQKLIDARRESPTDDLMTVLVEAEIDGEKLTDQEIVMGFVLLMTAGNDSTKATFCSGMRALMENPEQRQMLLDDPSLIPDAVEEALRMFPAFAHFRRTATATPSSAASPDQEGRQGRHVVPVDRARRVRLRGPRPLRRDAQARTPGLRRRRPPLLPGYRAGAPRAAGDDRGDAQALPGHARSTGEPRMAQAIFINQLTTLPVRLGP